MVEATRLRDERRLTADQVTATVDEGWLSFETTRDVPFLEAVFGRAFGDAPYAGLQRTVEAAGRRVTGLRDRSVHAGTDDVGTEDGDPAAWTDEPAGDGDRSGGRDAARGPR